ncbi:hypothetical protein AAG570_009467, partial [Ranatra chinensis]
ICIYYIQTSQCIELTAHLSENGVHGSITFSSDEENVLISTRLNTDQQWSWSIREFPVIYTELEDRCIDRKLGALILDFTALFGPLNNSTAFQSKTDLVPLIGQQGLWARSLLLQSESGARACATIVASGNSSVKIAEALFSGENGVGGKVFLQWFGSSLGHDAIIYTDIYNLYDKKRKTEHEWGIYTTDILDSDADKARGDCNSLQLILMDLTARVGKLISGQKKLLRDPNLSHFNIANVLRNHYIVVLDDENPEVFLACARIRLKPPLLLKALIASHGVKGIFTLEQESILTATKVSLNVTEVAEPVLGGFRIHSLPAIPMVGNDPYLDHCKGIGDVYNPTSKPLAAESPSPGEETQDRYAVGDISGKVGYAAEKEWDSFVPLSGRYSVAHRTLVIYRNGEKGYEEPWICAPLIRYFSSQPEYKVPMITAEAVYRYPLVGRIIFQQPYPYGDTSVLIEGLVHADGTTLNTTREHRWGVHINPPGKDFFNWTARCVSAGPVYDPYKVNINVSAEYVVGALSNKFEMLTIAGSKKEIQVSRQLFTDDNLPLSSRHSILGKSLVIFDDHGPKARGERLACSKIMSIFRRKAVVRDWFGNGIPASVSGKIEFYQQTEYGITDIEVNLEGLKNINHYGIYMTPVLEILEFPCEETTLYGVYNPYGISNYAKNPGTPDNIKVGDLSGKFGTLEGHSSLQKVGYNDSTLMIFGQRSILGRSIVLQAENDKRWACGTIERGYAPSEAREIRAIASFHHPNGFAYGYIRMTQLIHNDGSGSETVIEVNLRHPGKQDRNQTLNHNWAIYVNPVGVDAAVKILNTRCTAAGYVWNPYYTQLADPLNDDLYRRECGADLPLRCYVGDLSGRLGTIDLGKERKVFSDPNFPLEGPVSAMGRSIVILNKERGSEKFACANIEPDYDTVKYVNVKRPPKFIVSQFLEDVRKVMGIPDWFLTVDARKTNVLYNGACIQLLVHFKGPQANKLEQDFNRLLSIGHLASPSLYIPGYIPDKKKRPSTVSYKLCPSRENNGGNRVRNRKSSAGKVSCGKLFYFWVS